MKPEHLAAVLKELGEIADSIDRWAKSVDANPPRAHLADWATRVSSVRSAISIAEREQRKELLVEFINRRNEAVSAVVRWDNQIAPLMPDPEPKP